MKLFDQMIRPILCYGTEIWSIFDGNKKVSQNTDGILKFLDSLNIENVHVKFCKFLLGITSEVFVLLKEKFCDCYIKYWSDRI